MASSCEVCVVGSLNYDQIAYVGAAPKPGQTIYGKRFVTGFGGKGANQCVMSAKLGVKAAMIGALGSDEIARRVPPAPSRSLPVSSFGSPLRIPVCLSPR